MRLLLTFWKPLSFHLSHPLSVGPQSHEHPSCVLSSLSSLLSPCPLSSLRHLCTGQLTIQEPLNVPWLSVPHSRCLRSGSSYSGQSSLSSSLCLSPVCACCHCLSLSPSVCSFPFYYLYEQCAWVLPLVCFWSLSSFQAFMMERKMCGSGQHLKAAWYPPRSIIIIYFYNFCSIVLSSRLSIL